MTLSEAGFSPPPPDAEKLQWESLGRGDAIKGKGVADPSVRPETRDQWLLYMKGRRQVSDPGTTGC